MPHGHPDYGTGAPVSTVYSIQDMAELAARLGSIVTFDRRGNVLLMEDFEGSLAKAAYWQYSAGGDVSVSNLYALHGQFSCKFLAPAGGFASLYYMLPVPILSPMGVEFCFNRVDDGNLEYIDLQFNLDDNTNWWYAQLRWLAATGVWRRYTAEEFPIDLSPTVDYVYVNAAFHHVKLVIDYVTKKFVRLIADNLVYDLSAYSLNSGLTDAAPHIELILNVNAVAGGAAENYIDDIIITQNEP